MGAQDLTTFFRLDGDARRWVLTSHRGAPNQLGLALQVTRLPGRQAPKPLWLWWSRVGAVPSGIDRCWQAFLRRFDLEHTFRLFKQTLGWTTPKIRDAEAADR